MFLSPLAQLPTVIKMPSWGQPHVRNSRPSDTCFSTSLPFIFLGFSLKRKKKKIPRLLILDYFKKWVTHWCNCNKKILGTTLVVLVTKENQNCTLEWAPEQLKTCISVFKATCFTIFSEPVFFFQISASFPVPHASLESYHYLCL